MLFKPWQCIEAEEKSVIKMAEQGDALAQYRIGWRSSNIEADLVLCTSSSLAAPIREEWLSTGAI